MKDLYFIMEFPRDINNLIVKKLDIETRISLKIYTKLKIPESLQQKISNCFGKIEKKGDYVVVKIGPIRTMIFDDNSVYTERIYGIYRFFDNTGMYCNRVNYVPFSDPPTKPYLIIYSI